MVRVHSASPQIFQPASVTARRPDRVTRITQGLVLAVMGCLAGCYSEGGLTWSEDQYHYVSRTWQPWTVTLVDPRTGDPLWSLDVPLEQMLVVHFIPNAGLKGSDTPDVMLWGLFPEGTKFGPLPNRLPVPAVPNRRLDPTLRPVPEYAGNPASPMNRPPVVEVTTDRTANPETGGSERQDPTRRAVVPITPPEK